MIGVYFLFRCKVVVYIGSTRNWPARLTQHKEIQFDGCRIMECPDDKLIEYESRLIEIFKPRYNVQFLKVKRMPLQSWIAANESVVLESFRKNEVLSLINREKVNIGYSPKTQSSDIYWAFLRASQKHMGRELNKQTGRFTGKKV